ncbi:hypothetical protein PUR59_00465 [Streptomyces sp. SP18ES09]|uniref:hypothetical protein n=1 Tax=Streptomyces sp. SP18ES09 TaxID=3002532 RepID=UPI002E760F65|nr:hypothetical protein [Streptomyces sp. SP18ES09]MEE1813524.1 hypothetical protein [Streptomyces sp. SP18ES09]
MTEILDAPIAAAAEAVRAIAGPTERCKVSQEAESRMTEVMRAIRQELALDLKTQGLTWREVGELMGGVSPQRAKQISLGE